MNIFVLDNCPRVSARFLDNRRANKMIVESFQLMSNAMWINGSNGFYKATHLKHPCSIWIAKSRSNFKWVFSHADELLRLYTLRYHRVHKCEQYIETCKEYLNRSWAIDYQTPFANCTNFKEIADTHLAYRLHLAQKWSKENHPIPKGFLDFPVASSTQS